MIGCNRVFGRECNRRQKAQCVIDGKRAFGVGVSHIEGPDANPPEPLAVRVLRELRAACDPVLVASGDGERLAWLDAPQVADAISAAGPLGGIVAGVDAGTTELVAVVAVDMPYANAALLRLLASLAAGEEAIVPVTERGLEPLHALYAKAAAATLRDALRRGERSMHGVLRELRVREVGSHEWTRADPSGRFAINLNQPSDVQSSEETGSTF